MKWSTKGVNRTGKGLNQQRRVNLARKEPRAKIAKAERTEQVWVVRGK